VVPSEHLKIETHEAAQGMWAKMEIDTAAATEKLLQGMKLNMVLIGKTASGWQEQPGHIFLWDIALPTEEPTVDAPATPSPPTTDTPVCCMAMTSTCLAC
jgi:hypothetical protein